MRTRPFTVLSIYSQEPRFRVVYQQLAITEQPNHDISTREREKCFSTPRRHKVQRFWNFSPTRAFGLARDFLCCKQVENSADGTDPSILVGVLVRAGQSSRHLNKQGLSWRRQLACPLLHGKGERRGWVLCRCAPHMYFTALCLAVRYNIA